MSMIHPTAVIDPAAVIGEDVEIGPNCLVGPKVVVGDGCRLMNNVTLLGRTTIGRANEFFPGCVIGADPQDLKYRGTDTELVIGDENVFREHVTVHPGTEVGGGVTRIGHHNRFLVGVHIAHDVFIGNHCVISNATQVAGHCFIEDRVQIGGMTGMHQFVTVGRYSYVAGMTRVTIDVPPYLVMAGYDPRVRGVNVNGLARWGFEVRIVDGLWNAYRTVFGKRADAAKSMGERIDMLRQEGVPDEHVRYLLDFLQRSLREGVYSRYRETLRTDTDVDRRRFYNDAERFEGHVQPAPPEV